MARIPVLSVAAALLVLALTGCERQVGFSADVKPILDKHCAQCHTARGEGQMASGFAVDDYDSVMKGTKFGQVVVPGSALSSALYLVVTEKVAPEIHMPPHHNEAFAQGRGAPLSKDDIEIIEAWIDQGAKAN